MFRLERKDENAQLKCRANTKHEFFLPPRISVMLGPGLQVGRGHDFSLNFILLPEKSLGSYQTHTNLWLLGSLGKCNTFYLLGDQRKAPAGLSYGSKEGLMPSLQRKPPLPWLLSRSRNLVLQSSLVQRCAAWTFLACSLSPQ